MAGGDKSQMLILGVETSCDETAAAILRAPDELLSNVVSSQVVFHRPFGGVVPEVASRKHMEWIVPVIREALQKAQVGLSDLHGIGVTQGPGLVGSLLVGLSAAKAISYALGLPLVGVNHLEAHIAAAYLEHPELKPPFVALVVSGGHTALYEVGDSGTIRLMGRTRDDAAGEAFDKVAKILGLGYPGGPEIERAAGGGSPDAVSFPRAMSEESTLEFSFSGLKTSVLHHVRENCLPPLDPETVSNIAASFQEAVVDVLVQKTLLAAERLDLCRVVITGGVACNGRLREKMIQLARERGVDVFFPSAELCTDNAAMVARAAYDHLRAVPGGVDLSMDARSRWSMW